MRVYIITIFFPLVNLPFISLILRPQALKLGGYREGGFSSLLCVRG